MLDKTHQDSLIKWSSRTPVKKTRKVIDVILSALLFITPWTSASIKYRYTIRMLIMTIVVLNLFYLLVKIIDIGNEMSV